jgi:hypothetical protein
VAAWGFQISSCLNGGRTIRVPHTADHGFGEIAGIAEAAAIGSHPDAAVLKGQTEALARVLYLDNPQYSRPAPGVQSLLTLSLDRKSHFGAAGGISGLNTLDFGAKTPYD